MRLRIREARIRRGFPAKIAAKFLEIPYSTYMSYERGVREPSIDTLVHICDLYNCSAEYVFGRTEVMELQPEQLYGLEKMATLFGKSTDYLLGRTASE